MCLCLIRELLSYKFAFANGTPHSRIDQQYPSRPLLYSTIILFCPLAYTPLWWGRLGPLPSIILIFDLTASLSSVPIIKFSTYIFTIIIFIRQIIFNYQSYQSLPLYFLSTNALIAKAMTAAEAVERIKRFFLCLFYYLSSFTFYFDSPNYLLLY